MAGTLRVKDEKLLDIVSNYSTHPDTPESKENAVKAVLNAIRRDVYDSFANKDHPLASSALINREFYISQASEPLEKILDFNPKIQKSVEDVIVRCMDWGRRPIFKLENGDRPSNGTDLSNWLSIHKKGLAMTLGAVTTAGLGLLAIHEVFPPANYNSPLGNDFSQYSGYLGDLLKGTRFSDTADWLDKNLFELTKRGSYFSKVIYSTLSASIGLALGSFTHSLLDGRTKSQIQLDLYKKESDDMIESYTSSLLRKD